MYHPTPYTVLKLENHWQSGTVSLGLSCRGGEIFFQINLSTLRWKVCKNVWVFPSNVEIQFISASQNLKRWPQENATSFSNGYLFSRLFTDSKGRCYITVTAKFWPFSCFPVLIEPVLYLYFLQFKNSKAINFIFD